MSVDVAAAPSTGMSSAARVPDTSGSPAPVGSTVSAAVSPGSSGSLPPSSTPAASAVSPRTALPGQPALHMPAVHAVPRVVQCTAAVSSLKVDFSEDMDPKDAETVEKYIIENPSGQTQSAIAAVYNAATRTVLLSGLHLSLDDPIKVTVRNVRDRHGNPISSRANSAVYSEVTLWKYVLGFGNPDPPGFPAGYSLVLSP